MSTIDSSEIQRLFSRKKGSFGQKEPLGGPFYTVACTTQQKQTAFLLTKTGGLFPN